MRNIVIFSKTNCPYCVSAKQFLIRNGYTNFEEKVVGINATREELLEAAPNARTVPQILINGNLIGGYDDLVRNWNTIKEQYLAEQTFLAE
jgi:glutaredoxin 3